MRNVVLLLTFVSALQAQKFYPDDPIVKWPKPAAADAVKPRRLNEYYDFFQNSMFKTGELQQKSAGVIAARGVNTMGEVPDSEWYTNRHYQLRMSADELQRGPGNSEPPSMDKPWRVVSAKSEGITPGFTIVDGEGRRYLLKFDPKTNPEIASAADVIGSKFFYALGYNVPENYVVRFRPGQLKIDGNTKFTDPYGKRRPMRQRDLDGILDKIGNGKDEIRALASRFIPGSPVGPFRYYGTRNDDPNDTIAHEHRRELRGLRVFAAWLGHDDSKSLNTLDTLVKEDGVPYVRHYLIDFGAALGSASYGPNSPRSGNDYMFEWGSAARQFLTLGMAVPKWAHAKYPALASAGAFEYEVFDPERWVPEYPNPAFSNMNPDDAFWAARQVMAFTEPEIRAIVKTGEYSDPRAEEWVVRCLIERRNKIGRAFFRKVLPVDRFVIRNGRLDFADLSANHFNAEQVYRIQWYTFDNRTNNREKIEGGDSFAVPASGETYLLAEIQGERAGQMVRVFVRNRREVVGREMAFSTETLLSKSR